MIRNILILSGVFLVTIITGVIAVIAPFWHNWIILTWSKIILGFIRVRIRVEGVEHLDGLQYGVIVINHESALDIPVTVAGIRRPMRFLAKKELFRIPVFGWAMYLSGHISVDRQNRQKAIRSINIGAAKVVKKQRFITVSPEGTRSYDGKIAPFKKGGFKLAQTKNLPIIPVTIIGSRFCVPNKRFSTSPGTVILVVSPPVKITDFASLNDCIRQVREEMIKIKARYEGSLRRKKC